MMTAYTLHSLGANVARTRRSKVHEVIGKYIADNRGSISVLTIGLFIVTLTTALVLTDISAIYLAKRNLTLATESAAQRGMKNIDEKSYYQGEYNSNRAIATGLGYGEEDPGIPIDCSAGERDAWNTLRDWAEQGLNISRVNLSQIYMSHFECDGFQLLVKSEAVASMPIPLPFIQNLNVKIHAQAGGLAERAVTNNYSGFDLG